MIIAISKTDNISYLVNAQYDSGTSWTKRVPEAELKSTIIRACPMYGNVSVIFTISGDIPDDVKDTINQLSQFQCTA